MNEYIGFDERPETNFVFEPLEIEEILKNGRYSCIIGPNNAGKSFLLKCLAMEWEGKATYLGPARYSNFNALSPYAPQPDRKNNWYRQFSQQFASSAQNLDNSPFNTQQAIAELDNERRGTLFQIIEEVLGAKLSLQLAYPENEMSQRYISCNGHNFSYASSGTRLIVSIVTSLMDREFSHFLIDEPELGISPQAQGVLSDFIFNRTKRKKYFPHIEKIIFATHSALFLDKQEIGNNYIIDKVKNTIIVKRLSSLSEFNKIHFNLLGNRLESLFLPSYIFIVEGKTDEAFLKRVFEMKFPNNKISVINAGNDSEIKRYANMIKQIFPDLQNSPYKNRIFPVLDSIHGKGISDKLIGMGIPSENIIVWENNGIEYVYPESILTSIFGGAYKLDVSGDEIAANGQSFKKVELAERVNSMLDSETNFSKEFTEKILSVIR